MLFYIGREISLDRVRVCSVHGWFGWSKMVNSCPEKIFLGVQESEGNDYEKERKDKCHVPLNPNAILRELFLKKKKKKESKIKIFSWPKL